MTESNIIVVFPKIEDAKHIRNLLVRYGYEVAGVCTAGAQALNCADRMAGGIIVCGYRFADMLYSELLEELPRGFEMLLLASRQVVGESEALGVVSVTMPIKVQDLLETLEMMFRQRERRRKKKRQKPPGRSKEEQTVIDKAKKLLMERNNLTEEEAHRYIQKISMDSGNPMTETAEMILITL